MEETKLTEENQEAINKINHDIMEKQMKPVSRIYLDINTIKDTKLGLLIYLCKDDSTKMQYLGDNLDNYNKRITRNFVDTLPGLSFVENELVNKYQDPLLSADVFDHSPDTDLMYLLPKYLHTFQTSNSQKGYHDQIFITINFHPLKDNNIIKSFIDLLNKILPKEHFVLKPIFTPYSEITDSYWTTFDILILDNLKEAVAGPLGNVLFNRIEEQLFANKKIYAPYQADQEAIDIWLENGLDLNDADAVRERFELTTIYFRICCDFQYVPYLIPINNEVAHG